MKKTTEGLLASAFSRYGMPREVIDQIKARGGIIQFARSNQAVGGHFGEMTESQWFRRYVIGALNAPQRQTVRSILPNLISDWPESRETVYGSPTPRAAQQ